MAPTAASASSRRAVCLPVHPRSKGIPVTFPCAFRKRQQDKERVEQEKSVKGSIRKIPSESVIRLWRNFFVMVDYLVRHLEEALLRLPFSKSSEWKVEKSEPISDLENLVRIICFWLPQVGLEPTTLRLTAECSAIELLRNISFENGMIIPLSAESVNPFFTLFCANVVFSARIARFGMAVSARACYNKKKTRLRKRGWT